MIVIFCDNIDDFIGFLEKRVMAEIFYEFKEITSNSLSSKVDIEIIQLKTITRYAKNLYMDYINNLVNNLKTVSNELPTSETEKAIFIEVKGKIPPSNWSDTASFSAVNELVNPYKILFLGGLEMKSGTIKLSIRCSRKYLENNNENGVNKIISRIKNELGGVGGGHKLAGGIRLSKPSYNRLKTRIDEFI